MKIAEDISTDGLTSIESVARKCASSFIKALEVTAPDQNFHAAVQDQVDRFKIWAGNLGVGASATASIDFRLKDDDQLKAILLILLSRLDRQLLSIASPPSLDPRPTQDEDNGRDEENSRNSCSSSSESTVSGPADTDEGISRSAKDNEDTHDLEAVSKTVNQLYRFAAAIKKPRSLQEKKRLDHFIQKDKLTDEVDELDSFLQWKIGQMMPDSDVRNFNDL